MPFKTHFLLLFSIFSISSIAQTGAPAPVLPLPSASQLAWQKMEYYGFIHLSVNSYTDMAWGNGNEDPKLFNPTALDCNQWARTAKAAGMMGIILTAKHHSGFCLWPSQYTEYSVKNSPWKGGKGDIVREMANACKAYGLKLGIYLSPWDRNRADYGTPEYITYFRNQLTELLTNYGPIFEVWFDGANGGSGYYGGANETRKIDRTTYYDWSNTYKLVRRLQPNILIWNDGGERGDLRWVGTEAGYVGETNWSLLDSTGDVPEMMLRHGVENGNKWVPGEVNTSVRPEWFYHKKEDAKVKTVPQLLDIYYNSIGRNGTLLLNFPIMPNGLIHPTDVKAVTGLKAAVDKAFANNLLRSATVQASSVRGSNFAAQNATDIDAETYWAPDSAAAGNPWLEARFAKPTTFNRFLVQEAIALGQRVKTFTLEAYVNNTWKTLASETTIGYKRILRFPTVTATRLRLTIASAKSTPLIANMQVFDAPQILAAPVVQRNRFGVVTIFPADAEAQVFYTANGTQPSSKTTRYTGPVSTGSGKVMVRAIAFDPKTGRQSAVAEERFDVARRSWRILGSTDTTRYNSIDGNPETQWYQSAENDRPIDLVIDLGRSETVKGFKYLPDQNWWASGIISKYVFFVSQDGIAWNEAATGEFANIKNNPVLQVKLIAPQKARFIKLRAVQNTEGNAKAGYAEVDIITQ